MTERTHNQPPEPIAFLEAKEAIAALLGKVNKLKPVETQAQADMASRLRQQLQAARDAADTARKEEVAPYDAAKKAAQDRWNLLIGKNKSVTGTVILAMEACDKALRPFLVAQEEAKRAAEAEARAKAEAAQREAQEAMQASSGDIEARAAAEQLVAGAKQADRDAKRAERAKAGAHGGLGRATSLRTSYRPVLVDGVAAARHYWLTRRHEMETYLVGLAQQDVRAGKHEIPGFRVDEIKNVV